MRIRFLTPVIAAIAIIIIAVGGAAADGARATKGDATAVLNAFGNGGWAVLNHSEVAQGAPSQGLLDSKVAIRPLPPFEGAHYCELDWHTIVLVDIEEGPAKVARAFIADIDMDFTLDGSPLAVTRTAVKPFLNAAALDLDSAYYSQWGRVMAPSELAVGNHTLEVLLSYPGETPFLLGITFYVDAAGTGACL